MNTRRIFTWGIFIIVIILIIWGLILAEKKSKTREIIIPLAGQISDKDQVRGNASSTVTLIEYSDFQCPACAMYYSIIERIYYESSTTIKFAYRHFPLTQHKHALSASKASEASGKQGKFWEMYSKIFSTQTEWQDLDNAKPVFEGFAKEIGLDMEKYLSDLDSKEIADKINIDQQSGIKYNVNSTPTFFLNGKKINNPANYEEFRKIINEAISKTI